MVSPQPRDSLDSVHAVQVVIDERDRVPSAAVEVGQRALDRVLDVRLEAGRTDHVGERVAGGGRVVQDERARPAGHDRAERVERLGLGQADRERKRRSMPGRARRRQRAAHALGESARDGQAQTRAAVAARRRGVGLRERLEQAVQALGLDPDAGVAHRDAQTDRSAARRLGGDAQNDLGRCAPRRRGARELDRVREQVEQDLAQPRRVAHQAARDAQAHVRDQLDASPHRVARDDVDGVLDQVADHDRLRLQVDAVSLDLGKVQHVRDHAQERLAGRADGVQRLALLRRERRRRQHVRHADDAVERRPDLVAHRRQKVAFGLRRCERLGAGALQAFERLEAHPKQVRAQHGERGQGREKGALRHERRLQAVRDRGRRTRRRRPSRSRASGTSGSRPSSRQRRARARTRPSATGR